MNTETCLHCAHADFRAAAARGLPGFVVCTVSREQAWRVLNPQTECENGRFQTASAQIVQKRVEWLDKRRKRRLRPSENKENGIFSTRSQNMHTKRRFLR